MRGNTWKDAYQDKRNFLINGNFTKSLSNTPPIYAARSGFEASRRTVFHSTDLCSEVYVDSGNIDIMASASVA